MEQVLKIDPNWTSYFDVTFNDCHIIKALRERDKAIKKELKDYEAFDLMHKYDGTFTKSESGLSRL